MSIPKEFISEFTEVTECLEDSTETFISIGVRTPVIPNLATVLVGVDNNNDVSLWSLN
jgi:hypothetical protein